MEHVIHRPYWFKSTIAEKLGVGYDILGDLLSDEVKERVKWRKGIQKFKDAQVIDMLQDLFPAKNDTEIRQIIGYNAQYGLNFQTKSLNS